MVHSGKFPTRKTLPSDTDDLVTKNVHTFVVIYHSVFTIFQSIIQVLLIDTSADVRLTETVRHTTSSGLQWARLKEELKDMKCPS